MLRPGVGATLSVAPAGLSRGCVRLTSGPCWTSGDRNGCGELCAGATTFEIEAERDNFDPQTFEDRTSSYPQKLMNPIYESTRGSARTPRGALLEPDAAGKEVFRRRARLHRERPPFTRPGEQPQGVRAKSSVIEMRLSAGSSGVWPRGTQGAVWSSSSPNAAERLPRSETRSTA